VVFEFIGAFPSRRFLTGSVAQLHPDAKGKLRQFNEWFGLEVVGPSAQAGTQVWRGPNLHC
jgi:hypothetical protein